MDVPSVVRPDTPASGRRVASNYRTSIGASLTWAAVAAAAALTAGACAAPPPAHPTRSTGELTFEEACRMRHGVTVGPAVRTPSAVRLTFGDDAHDQRTVLYRVWRRPADKASPWAVVAELR